MNELSLPLWMQKYATRVNAELGDKIESEKYLSFPGKIEYSDNLPDIAAACEILLNIAETREELILGFDIEWPFDYKSGPGKTSLIQICPDKSVCYLFHVIKLTGLPRALILLLRNPKIKFVGLNVKNDFQKLGRDFRLDVNQIIKNSVIELSTLANEKLLCAEKWSLDRLVLNQLNLNLDKSIKVRMSNWSHYYLSNAQLIYAATDAYASLLCYRQLNCIGLKFNSSSSLYDEFPELPTELSK